MPIPNYLNKEKKKIKALVGPLNATFASEPVVLPTFFFSIHFYQLINKLKIKSK